MCTSTPNKIVSNYLIRSIYSYGNINSNEYQYQFQLIYCIILYFIAEPITTIHGSPDLYIDTGSTVNLTCIVRHLPEPPAAIQWTHNNEVSTFEMPFREYFAVYIHTQTHKRTHTVVVPPGVRKMYI